MKRDTEKNPLVSISIITYNQIGFVKETLESALEQDYDNLEVVVADDGSTDGTSEIILQYAEKYPGRLVPIVGGPNLGITGNSNRALKACKGKYVAFQGGDDVLLNKKISTQVEWMERRKNYVISYHDVEVFDSESGNLLWTWFEKFKPRVGDAGTVIKHGTFMPATSVMIRREKCSNLYFDSRIKIASDWLFWIDVLANTEMMIGPIEEVYARYRRHGNNVTSVSKHFFQEILDTLDIVKNRYPNYANYCKSRRSFIHLQEAKNRFSNEKKLACSLVFESLRPRNGFGFFGLATWLRKIFGLRV